MSCFVSRFSQILIGGALVLLPVSLFSSQATSSPLYRSIDGTGNNIANPDWGAAGIQLLRLGTASYSDGISSLAGSTRPSTRSVSNSVSAQSGPILNTKNASDFVWQWGQFLDHDIDLSHSSTAEPAPIPVPGGDPVFSSDIGFNRSVFDPATGTSTANPRQQVNSITAFIDASNVYGSDAVTAATLRSFSGGRLKTTPSANGDLLMMVSSPQGPMFMAGDERANEQSGLTAMHTLFMREHNRLADEIAAANPGFDDEKIYQEARKLVGGMVQVITYKEFLPYLLGSATPGAYGGYDDTVNPGISNEFSTAAYRFGHSMLSPQLLRLDENGNEIPAGHLPLEQAFFNPSQILDNGGIEPILRGLASQSAQDVDPYIIDAVRNLLFGPPVDVGFDLAALNMQRGRDHGLPGYNEMRDLLPGLAKYDDWDDAEFLPGVKELLMSIYDTIDDVDLWIGGLSELHVNDGLMGELFAAILFDQFDRLRAGDRFWYENGMFEQEWLDFIESSTLGEIIMRNTDIETMPFSVFTVPEPGSLAVFAFGLAGMGLARRRRLKRAIV